MTRARDLARLGNSQALTVDTNLNVGIGSTTPDVKLDVVGIVSATSFYGDGSGLTGIANTANIVSTAITTGILNVGTTALISASSGFTNGLALNTGTTAPIVFLTNSAERMRLDSSGRLGLGTSTFSYLANKLVIDKGATANDGITIVSSDTSNACIWFADGTVGSDAYRGGLDYQHSSDKLNFYVGGSINVTIDSSGRFGVGTASPAVAFEVSTTSPIIRSTHNLTGDYLQLFHNGSGAYLDYSADDLIIRSASNTERARIDSSGRLLVGTSSARSNFFNSTNSAANQIEGASNDGATLAVIQNFNGASNGAVLILAKSNGSSVGSNTIIANTNIVGQLSFQGNDGTEFTEAASIRAEVDGTPGANDMPGRLVFSTTADGASSPSERMRIKSTGIVNVGNTPVYADNAAAKTGGLVDGDIYRKSDGTLMIVYT